MTHVSDSPLLQTVTVTFRAWMAEGSRGEGGMGVLGIGRGGVGNNGVLSVQSHVCKDILGIDKDLNVS